MELDYPPDLLVEEPPMISDHIVSTALELDANAERQDLTKKKPPAVTYPVRRLRSSHVPEPNVDLEQMYDFCIPLTHN